MSWDEQIGGYDASIPAPVLDDPALRWPAMILYANIKRYAWKSGFCYATNETLLRAMSREDPKSGAVSIPSERTLQSWLSELRERGHIHMDTGPIPPGRDGTRRIGRRIFIGIKLADIPESGGEENFTPEDFCAKGVKKSSPHTTKVIKESNTPLPPTTVMKRITEYAGEDDELKSAILGLVLNRKEALGNKKAVKTLRTMNGILNDLDVHSSGNRQQKLLMLAKAVKNNWLTVYPLKPDELPNVQTDDFNEEGTDGI